jgi:hypothetical protein
MKVSCTAKMPQFADPDAAIVELRTSAARCGEQFLAHGIVDYPVFDVLLVLDRDRYREMRHAVQEIRRAVQRVDDPQVVVAGLPAAFLGENTVVGIGSVCDRDDFLFGQPIHLADEIVALFALDAQCVDAFHMAYDHIAGGARGTDRNVQHGMNHGRPRISDEAGKNLVAGIGTSGFCIQMFLISAGAASGPASGGRVE